MELNIYNKEGVLKLTASPSDNSTRQKRLMGDHLLSLSFTAFECVSLEVYDYVDFEGARFWIMEEYTPAETSTVEWEYDCKFYGVESLIKQALVLKLVDGENNPIFSLTAPAREHMTLIVANINRQMGTTDWKVGEVLATENLTLDYEGTYCDEALSVLADAAKTEFWADGLTMNLCRCEYGDKVLLGYDKGLLSLERETADNIKFFTRLFPVGSTRNIDPEEYGYSRLQLPNRKSYVERNTQQGIVEHYERDAFSGIYPRRIGTISSIRSDQKTGEDGKPFTIYYVKDASLTFDPNSYEIGGLVKQMTFQSGELNGRDFEVNYDTKEKEFEIITQWPYDDDTQLPGGLLIPKVGDEYILWNIRMPKEYYALAEQEFAETVDAYFDEHDKDRYVYKGSTDYVDLAERALALDVGQRIRLENSDYFPVSGYRDSRIISITQNIVRPTEMDIEMSDVLGKSTLTKIEEELGEVKHYAQAASAALPDIVRSWENTPPSDFNLFSAKRSCKEFLSKRQGGTVEGQVRFMQRITLDKGFRTHDFASGPTGFGGQIDERGVSELESLVLRRSLTVPELNYNRVEISVGDDWSAPGGGIIKEIDTLQQLVTLKLEDGERGAVAVGDICMGIFHSTTLSDNAAEDADDSRGNRTFAGFATAYFRITEVLGDHNEQFKYELRPVSTSYPAQIAPMISMKFVAYGSFTDASRRTSRYSTRTYQRYLRGVSGWEFTAENIAAQFGDLSNLSVFGLVMSGYSAYLDNIYMQGLLRSLDGTFIIDTKTRSLLMASGKTGVGLAFNPEQGLKIGAVYDPETGKFQKEYDIEQIAKTANDTKEELDNLQIGGVNLLNDSESITFDSQGGVWGKWNSVNTETFEGYKCAVVRNPKLRVTNGAFLRLEKVENAQIAEGSSYMASAYVWANEPVGIRIGLENSEGFVFIIDSTMIGKWIRLSSYQKAVKDNPAFVLYANPTASTTVVAFRMAQLEDGNKVTAWFPSVADQRAAINAAHQAANNAAEEVDSLKNFTDETFADGIIDRAEAASIEKYINSVTETKDAVDASYTVVYENSLLGGTAKSNLHAAKSTLDTVIANLLASISSASVDGIATADEKADVDAKYKLFNAAYSIYTTRIEEAQKYIQIAINTTAQGAYQLSQELQTTVNNLNESIIPDLQNQIDKQIISYNGTDVPTLSNYPAVEWVLDTERNRHINDYYDRKITDSGREVSYERYKFVYENNVYQWVRIADSGVAEAQAKALEALGVADSKNKIYFGDTTPAVPYSINDLWIKISGDIYLCNADRPSGATGSAADWQLANDAQMRLRQMSSDNVISKEEKASLRNTLIQREKEMAAYAEDAATYGVSISALNTAYRNMVNFLSGTVAVNNDTDAELTSEQRASYNGYFAAYDAEVCRFMNLVADAVAQQKVNDMQLGTNILNGSHADWVAAFAGGSGYATGDSVLYLDHTLIRGKQITYRVELKGEGAQVPQLGFEIKVHFTDNTDQWLARYTTPDIPDRGTFEKAYTFSSQVQDKEIEYARLYPVFRSLSGGELSGKLYVRHEFVGVGNKLPSTWSPSVADQEVEIPDLEYLKELFPASTEVDGAVIAQMLAVKDDTGSQIMGFINGSSDFSDPTHGVCMIAMGISNITGWNSAKTRLYADGHFVSASAEITGKITAQTGAIGPFTITTSYLTGTEGSSSLRLSSDLIRFTSGYGAAYIGKDTFPSSMGGSIISPARFEVSRIASSGEANAGIYISVSGATDYDDMIYSGNHALYIAKGDICGLRFRVRRVSSSQTLSEMDTFILVTASGTIDLTLPSSPQPGQLYFFKLIGSGKFNIKVGTSGHKINNNRSASLTTWGFNSAPIIMLVWDRVNSTWQAGHLNVG